MTQIRSFNNLKNNQMKNYLLDFQAKISHYVINDVIFIDYMDAFKFCIKNNLDINLIIKTKKYI